MSYNGSGVFEINSFGQPVVPGTLIEASVFNLFTEDIAGGLSNAITRDGQSSTTVRIPFAFGINSSLTDDATNVNSGSIISQGGLGVAKSIWAAANKFHVDGVTGTTTIGGALTAATSIATGTGTTTTAGLKLINGAAGAGDGFGCIYPENITPSTTNYAFVAKFDGSVIGVNAASGGNISLAVGGAAVLVANTGAIAVTGTLTVSNAVSGLVIGSGTTTNVGWTIGYLGVSGYSGMWATAIGTKNANTFNLSANDTAVALNSSAATRLNVANTTVLTCTAGAVSIAGALTVSTSIAFGTGTTTTAGLKMLAGSAGVGSQFGAIYAENIAVTGSNYSFATKADGGVTILNAGTTVQLKVADAGKLNVDATGITVTGAAVVNRDAQAGYVAAFTNPNSLGRGVLIQGGGGAYHPLTVQSYEGTERFRVSSTGDTVVTGNSLTVISAGPKLALTDTTDNRQALITMLSSVLDIWSSGGGSAVGKIDLRTGSGSGVVRMSVGDSSNGVVISGFANTSVDLTVTSGLPTTNRIGMVFNGMTTGANSIEWQNSGGISRIGVANSAGAGIVGTGNPYALQLYSQVGNIDIWAGAARTIILTPSAMLLAGTLRVTTLGAFASGDKYVIVDANGNFHKSALGPAS